MRRKLAILVVALLGTFTALGVSTQAARANSNCLYNHYSTEHYDAKYLSDGNYIDIVMSIWVVNNNTCTEWSGHLHGDTQVAITYYLGTTADYFGAYQPSAQTYGYVDNGYPTCNPPGLFGYFPTHSDCEDSPFWNRDSCLTVNVWSCSATGDSGQNWNPSAIEATTDYWSGPNDTTLEVTSSSIAQFECDLGGQNDVADSTGTGNDTNGSPLTNILSISGSNVTMPYFNYIPNYAGTC